MDEIMIEERLLDYEPTGSRHNRHGGASDAGDITGIDGAPGTDSRPEQRAGTGAAAGHGPKPNGRPNARGLGKSFGDIAASSSVGSAAFITGANRSNELARAELERAAKQRAERQRYEQAAYESTLSPAGPRLIADIRPSIPERMAVVEQRSIDAHEDIKELRHDMHVTAGAVAKQASDDNRVLDRRIDNEILPAIERVARKNQTKLIATTIAAFVGFAASFLQLYYYFVVKHL